MVGKTANTFYQNAWVGDCFEEHIDVISRADMKSLFPLLKFHVTCYFSCYLFSAGHFGKMNVISNLFCYEDIILNHYIIFHIMTEAQPCQLVVCTCFSSDKQEPMSTIIRIKIKSLTQYFFWFSFVKSFIPSADARLINNRHASVSL